MKKILFLFLMVMGLISSASALDIGQSGCDIEKSQWGEGADSVTVTPSDVTFVKIDIWHKDTLMYGWEERDSNKKIMKMSGYKQNINLASATIAVVCYPRGETGV